MLVAHPGFHAQPMVARVQDDFVMTIPLKTRIPSEFPATPSIIPQSKRTGPSIWAIKVCGLATTSKAEEMNWNGLPILLLDSVMGV